MFALLLVPLAAFWAADNHAFLTKVTDADWQYVGYRERAPGRQTDGAEALTMEVGGKTFILFKQRPEMPDRPHRDVAENTN